MTRKTFLEWLVLFVAAVLLNCGGQRCLQVIILPLLVVEVIALFMESGHLRQKLPGGRYLATAYVGSLVLAFLVSCLYGGRGDYAVYLLQPGEAVEKLLLGVPAALLENFGLVGNAKVGSFASLMQLLVWVFLILLGYGLWYVFRKNTESTDRQKDALTILLASVGVTAFIIGITSAEAAHYYFFMAWFAAAVLVAVMVDHMSEGQPVFAGLILTAVALFAVRAVDNNVVAFLGEFYGNGLSDPTGSAGHKHNFLCHKDHSFLWLYSTIKMKYLPCSF